eukprot:SAG31_NODE_476_length_15154_cov_24.796878_11_plen_182_part_00
MVDTAPASAGYRGTHECYGQVRGFADSRKCMQLALLCKIHRKAALVTWIGCRFRARSRLTLQKDAGVDFPCCSMTTTDARFSFIVRWINFARWTRKKVMGYIEVTNVEVWHKPILRLRPQQQYITGPMGALGCVFCMIRARRIELLLYEPISLRHFALVILNRFVRLTRKAFWGGANAADV